MKFPSPYSKFFWILLAGGSLYLVGATMLAVFLDIGLRLRAVSPVVEGGFYAVSGAILMLCFVFPLASVFLAPHLGPEIALDSADAHTVRSIAKRLCVSPIQDEQTRKLKAALAAGTDLYEPIRQVRLRRADQVRGIVHQHAVLAFVSTSISQNKTLDGLVLLGINARLVRQIVDSLGSRPGYIELLKIYATVFLAAITVENLDDVVTEDALSGVLGDFVKSVPFASNIAKSVVRGAANAVFTLYIGLLTECLIKRGVSTGLAKERSQVRRAAIKMLPAVSGDATKQISQMIGGSVRFAKDATAASHGEP